MPTYSFTNTKTNESWTEMMTISEMEKYLSDNPHVSLDVSAPSIVDPYNVGRMKTDGGFRTVLKKIKDKHRGSTIDTGNVTEL
jgi:hypothetical protein